MPEVLKPGKLGNLTVTKAQSRGDFMNLMIYGDSGTGKTRLAGSAQAVPTMAPVLVVDVEAGTETLRHTYPDVDVVRVKTWDEMQQVYDELHRGKHAYKSVVLDSLTEIQKFSMYQIMADLVDRKEEADPDVPGMREWGKNIEQVRKFVRAFRDLPMNAIFTALAKQDRNPRTGVVKNLPSLSGKVAQEVPAFLDIVTYLYIKQVEVEGNQIEQRLLLTAPTETTTAKDRTSRLPQVVVEPTMAELYKYILAESEAEADPAELLTASN